ncbi:MAG: hypothetical protein R2867_03165 [Caldilineaceae bacterium]
MTRRTGRCTTDVANAPHLLKLGKGHQLWLCLCRNRHPLYFYCLFILTAIQFLRYWKKTSLYG